MNKHKHLNLNNRITIHSSLNDCLSASKIGILLHKDPTTVSKEVKKHRTKHVTSRAFNHVSSCAHVRSCNKSHICSYLNCQMPLCRNCNICKSVCSDYTPDVCPKLLKFPFVCNGCSDRRFCKKSIKYFYDAQTAHQEYLSSLSEKRQGINISPERLQEIDSLVSPLVMDKDQPINHIFATHADEIGVSRRTLYNYIDDGHLKCKNIDLPRKTRFKPRKRNKSKAENKSKLRKGRTYDDFLKYMEENPYANIIQMDTVEGTKGGKVLLTLHCVATKFQIAHLLPNKEAVNVKKAFQLYYDLINDDELFKKYFAVILTDNGSEFTDIEYIESLGCKIFFCDPNRSDQKGSCEKNHEYIRLFLPKGLSFDHLHQRDIWNMMCHINSIKRESLQMKSPYEVTSFYWGEKILRAFHIKPIAPDKVILNSSIFK